MKTKTWQDRFDEYKLEECGKWKIDRVFAKQLISDLRKRDMEALIERLDYLDNNREEHQIIGEFKQLIKDYYEN